MFASAWAAVSAVPARFSISPAVHNAMHPGKRPRLRMPFDLPSYACQNSMADTGIARSPHSCGSKAGMSTTRRSSACGAKKGCCQYQSKSYQKCRSKSYQLGHGVTSRSYGRCSSVFLLGVRVFWAEAVVIGRHWCAHVQEPIRRDCAFCSWRPRSV